MDRYHNAYTQPMIPTNYKLAFIPIETFTTSGKNEESEKPDEQQNSEQGTSLDELLNTTQPMENTISVNISVKSHINLISITS